MTDDPTLPPSRDVWRELEALADTLGPATVTRSFRPRDGAPAPAAVPPRAIPATRITLGDEAVEQHSVDRAPPVTTEAAAVEGFRVLEKIGQGGVGVIYRAVQASLGREVALKQSADGGPDVEAQFVAEAQVTGRLEHANIIPVHLLGRAGDGAPVLAMKLVRGTSWADLIHGERGRGMQLRDHLQVLVSVCNAVAFAHREGVLHRDLKPANVMVGEFGQVFVMDWGLAARFGPRTSERAGEDPGGTPHVSDVRAPCGTPVYMAPELARGAGGEQGPWTDVYLLGACLHEVLAGAPRHAGDRVLQVLMAAIESKPAEYGPSVPRELAAIANRATARDPAQRFATVEAFRDAIGGFLEHREALALVAQGETHVAALRAAAARYAGGESAAARVVHDLHAEARFALKHALAIHPGADAAREALAQADRALLEHALAAQDLSLAERVMGAVDDASLRARVNALRAQARAREQELSDLREGARRLDWAAIAGPLGDVFMAAGLLGGAAAFMSWLVQRGGGGAPAGRAGVALAAAWALVALAGGALALARLRRARVPDSLLSRRMLGTWAAVAMGCVSTGITNELHHARPFAHSNYSATMIGIGFVAMALQTRAWLLAPAVLFFAGGVVMAAFPAAGLPLFGALWLLGLAGVGAAIRMGASLEARGGGEPGRSDSPRGV